MSFGGKNMKWGRKKGGKCMRNRGKMHDKKEERGRKKKKDKRIKRKKK
jgi:hypothetical protein